MRYKLMWSVLLYIIVLSLGVLGQDVHEHQHTPLNSDSSSLTVKSQDQIHTESSILPALLSGFFLLVVSVGLILYFRSMHGKDLLEYKWMQKLMRSKRYPLVLQLPTFVFFGFIVYYFFFGATRYADNPGSILSWTLWWPLVPLTFILFGRLWCLICPLPIVGDVIQKIAKPTRRPGQFIVKYGIWITDGLFIAITLFDRLYGMVDVPFLSGIVFALILFGVIVLSLRYERRTFCKHFCFLGGVSGNYSMLSGFSVESKDKTVCASCKTKDCYFGSDKAQGCPYANVVPGKIGMRNCTICANCIKSCPHNNIALRLRNIASELWSHARVSFSESFFAKLMVGIVIIQNLGMLAVWSDFTGYLMKFGFSEKAAISLLYFAAIAIPLLLMTLTSYLSSKRQTTPGSTVANFAAFGYAFIPIDVAGHIAHNLFHLLADGKSILGAFLGLFTGKVALSGAIASNAVIQGLQYGLVAVGGLGTLYVAYRIAFSKEQTKKGAWKILLPHAILLILIFAVNLYLFSQPMAHRGH